MTPANPFAASLGEIIRSQREMAELPLRQLAAMAGISNPYLSQIEHGLREPSRHVLEEIARSLQVSVDELLDGTADAQQESSEVREAVTADPHLTARQKQALIEVYEAMAEATAHRRGRRGSRRAD